MTIGLAVNFRIGGMDLPTAVEDLGIRPLAFGSAWKILDLLLEYSLSAAGVRPSNGSRWTIAEKTRHARAGTGQATPVSTYQGVWQRLLAAYAAAEQTRHSLVHRRATTDQSGALIGTDSSGVPLRPISKDEQVFFLRAVQRAVACISQKDLSQRDEAALLGELDQLAALTGFPGTGHTVVNHPPVPYRIPVEEGQELDLTRIKLRIRASSPTVVEFEARFSIGDQTWEVPLERLPDEVVTFSPSAPWLTPR